MTVLDILRAPWAIDPQVLTEICSIYAARRNGEKADQDVLEKFLDAKAGTAVATNGAGQNAPKNYKVQDGVALIPIEGILAKRMGLFQMICGGQSYTSIQQDIAQALADPNVTSIILTIDSPGGTVDGLEAAGDAIYNARSQKPIAAYVDGKATSAAYWLGSAASQMYIGSDADAVGSIGVMMTHIDTSAAETMRGVKYTDLTAGRYKGTGTPHKPLSGQDFGIFQDQLDQLYGNFVNTVARNRGTDPQSVADNMAEGRVFLGQKAIDAGLVDGKMTLPQLVQKMGGRSVAASARVAPPKPANGATRISGPGASTADPIPTPASATVPAPQLSPSPISSTPPQPPAPPSMAQLRLAKLQVLKAEEASIRRLLRDAEPAAKTAKGALFQASRTHPGDVKGIEPFVVASLRADETLRELQTRLRSNDQEQLAILCE